MLHASFSAGIDVGVCSQGIGPTLIAFRVAEEPSRDEINATSRSNSPSFLTFRRTARDTISDTQRPEVSTVQFGLSCGQEGVEAIQNNRAVGTQINGLGDEEHRDEVENMGYTIRMGGSR